MSSLPYAPGFEISFDAVPNAYRMETYADEPYIDFLALLHPDWHHRAACSGLGADWFFPGMGENAVVAKEVCASCSTRRECQAQVESMGAQAHFGVWNGTSEKDRRRARQARRRAS